jgi:hypothetical protein
MPETATTPAQQIALWAEKLHTLSTIGLHFSMNPCDCENH